MARSRNIKPGFFRNEVLAEMDFGTRLLFIGLWTLADKAGRLEDRPKKIKIEVFPADDVDVPSMLHALAMHDFITRYAVDSVRYIQINNFLKHQSPHHKEVESVIPGPESADPEQEKNSDKTTANPCATQAQAMHEPSMGQASPEKSTSSPLIPDSGYRIPDSGYLNPEQKTPSSCDDAPRQERNSSGRAKPDYEGIVNLYNNLLGEFLPNVVKLSDKRKKLINARWKQKWGENSRGDDLGFWRKYFLHVRRSKPLTGTKDGFDWSPNFDWLLNESNMLKVIEGNYHQGDDRRNDLQEAV